MNIAFDYYSISLLIGGFTALLSGFVVFIHNHKTPENISWFLFNITSAVWSFGYFSTIVATNRSTAFVSDWILHLAATLVPLFCLLSVILITDSLKKYKVYFTIASFFGLFFLISTPSTLFVRDVIPKAHFNFVPDAGPLYIYFTIYFFILVFLTLYVLFKKYLESRETINAQRFKYMFLFTAIGSLGGGSVFFLTFNIPILPYPIILFSLFPIMSIYAIFKFQLFNVKVLSTEVLVFTLWIFIFARALISTSIVERLINGGLLIFIIATGIFLIRSVGKEVSLREKVENLAKDLEVANDELEKANDRLKEVDQLKSEFLSLATHQIRAPLTAIKGYASLILEGDYGKLAPDTRSAVQTIFNSCQNLVVIVSEFLDISRIEQGRMKYDLVKFDVNKLLKEVVTELKPTIETANLRMEFKSEDDSNIVYADQGKIKQVIGNIIDNSIKYTARGGVVIQTEDTGDKIKISIKDTGIGVAPEDISKLFTKFTRAKDAFRINVIGTGLGLYVAKQMIEAQRGKVWVESEGLGKGSTFYIELPKNS